jgi:hypothetical protein
MTEEYFRYQREQENLKKEEEWFLSFLSKFFIEERVFKQLSILKICLLYAYKFHFAYNDQDPKKTNAF